MSNIDKTINLLKYSNNPMSKESISVLYSANNIVYERCELYSDFTQSLLMLIFDTYLGDDITDSTQQINHFKWCWKKNRENFLREGINIDDNKLYTYFLEFIMEVYYSLSKKNEYDKTTTNILKLWEFILNFNVQKSNADMDTMITVYKLFENSTQPIK